MTAIDLAGASVFLDFDGTISTTDVSVHLLERHAHDGWLVCEDDYRDGRIGSRECLIRQWACIRPDVSEAELRSCASEVPLDPGLAPLVLGLEDAGAQVAIVSDGYGFYIGAAVEEFGLDVFTNKVDFETGEVSFPFQDPDCPCGLCGTCKQSPMRAAQARGRTIVFVGDGASDRRAAPLADLLFAKDGLAEWCTAENIAFEPFVTLSDVADRLLAT